MADSYQTLRCPACGNIMKKVFIPSIGVNIDICSDGCGGLYFDAKELQLLQKVSGDDMAEINSYLEDKQFSPVDEQAVRMCPNCSTNMVKTKINGLNVQIDTCYTCGGIFLDYGEIGAIRSSYMQRMQKSSRESSYEYRPANDTSYIKELFSEAQREERRFSFNYGRSYYRWSDCIVDILGFLFRY